ncbi:hypothetical protein M0804_014229 [Polistes exclamans]|nr:hypothetical protein M0804_014231 [Polistes exclamans]KAI4475568.1 hypothetical protein M0804_014229 [Polistes exclamans]
MAMVEKVEVEEERGSCFRSLLSTNYNNSVFTISQEFYEYEWQRSKKDHDYVVVETVSGNNKILLLLLLLLLASKLSPASTSYEGTKVDWFARKRREEKSAATIF